MSQSSSHLANYLYLRGMLRIACGQNIKVKFCDTNLPCAIGYNELSVFFLINEN